MPYTKGAALASGPYTAGGTANNQQANNWETQYDEATQSFEQDLLTPFVFSGFTAARDGTTLSQLDVAAGVAFPKQADNTLRRRSLSSSTQSTAGHPSTTMYLFLNPDGTWAWQTSSTPPTNALVICHVTTDGSSNIVTVVDDRVIATSLLPGMVGTVAIPNAGLITFDLPLSAANQIADLQQSFGVFSDNAGGVFPGGTSRLWFSAANTSGTQEMHFGPRGGSGNALAGVRFITNNVTIDNNSSGSPGVFKVQGGVTTSLDAGAITTDGSGNLTKLGNVTFSGSPLLASRQSGAASGLAFESWSGSAAVVPWSVGGQFSSALSWVDNSGNFNGPIGGGIPTTRNGAALSVPIYTGSTTPSNPPTGSLWASA